MEPKYKSLKNKTSINTKKRNLELKNCTHKNFFLNNIYSKKNKDEKNLILKIFKNKKRTKKDKNIYSEILDKSPKRKKMSLIYKSKQKYLKLQNINKENKKIKENLKDLVYKSLSMKKINKKMNKEIEKKNNDYLKNLSKLEHRLEKYYKILKNDKNYLKTISLNEIINDFEFEIKKKNSESTKKNLKLKTNLEIDNMNLIKKNFKYKNNLKLRKRKSAKTPKSFILTPNFNKKSIKDKRFSIFFKKKKISFCKGKSVSKSKSRSKSKGNVRLDILSRNKKKLQKIIRPVKNELLNKLKDTTLIKNIRSKKKVKKYSINKNSSKHREITFLENCNLDFLINDLIINLKSLEEKKEIKREKSYFEKNTQTKENFQKKVFSDLFKEYIKIFLKKNSKEDFKLSNLLSFFKKSNFDLKEIDFETQKLLKIYFDSFQKQLVFDEIRKILNEEEVFIEDYFQEGFQKLHNKFIEENSEISSLLSNSTSNFTLTNCANNENESFRSILSLNVKGKIKKLFKSVQNTNKFLLK